MTITDVVNWVCTDILKRQDVVTVATNAAVNIYTVLTRKVAFDELMVTSPELPITQNVASYSLISGATQLTPVLNAIMSIRLTRGPAGSPSVRLRRSITRQYDALSYVVPGNSSTYARWGSSIELNPPPQGTNWTFRVRYWSKVVISSPAGDTVLVFDDAWGELMKWETLYRTYYALGMIQEAMALVTPQQLPRQGGSPRRQVMYEVGIIPRLWNDLLSTISAKENGDEDFSINPVVRGYSLSIS